MRSCGMVFLIGSLFELALMMTHWIKDLALRLVLLVAFSLLLMQPLLAAEAPQQVPPVQAESQRAENRAGQPTLGQVMDGLAPASTASDAPARTKPRAFRGNVSLLLVLSLLILAAFVLIFMALNRAKKSRAIKAWHE